MTEAAEEFDRTRALRRVAFHREIPTASLEGYWQRWDAPEIRNDPSTAPASMTDEYAALVSGEAVLQLSFPERFPPGASQKDSPPLGRSRGFSSTRSCSGPQGSRVVLGGRRRGPRWPGRPQERVR